MVELPEPPDRHAVKLTRADAAFGWNVLARDDDAATRDDRLDRWIACGTEDRCTWTELLASLGDGDQILYLGNGIQLGPHAVPEELVKALYERLVRLGPIADQGQPVLDAAGRVRRVWLDAARLADQVWSDGWLAGLRYGTPGPLPDQAIDLIRVYDDPVMAELEQLWCRAGDVCASADFRTFDDGEEHVDGGGQLDEDAYLTAKERMLRLAYDTLDVLFANPARGRAPVGAEREAEYGHPLQYAYVGSVYVGNTEELSDAEVQAKAGGSTDPVERYDRCPTCEMWSPCDARPAQGPTT